MTKNNSVKKLESSDQINLDPRKKNKISRNTPDMWASNENDSYKNR